MKIVHPCPTCKKPAEVKSEMKLGTTYLRTYKCGHTEVSSTLTAAQTDTLDITSLDGKRPFKFQIEGGRFLEAANGCALLADEMGIGKTVQTIMWLVAHPEVGPFVIFCKAGLKLQWMHEMVRWGDIDVQIVEGGGSSATFLKGFKGYIISLDSAWRIGKKPVKNAKGKIQYYEDIPGKTLKEQFARLGVKTAVIDECQLIKNSGSERTKGIQDACRDLPYKIGLSGTPIKNNAAEYFPILNLLRPDKFPVESHFLHGWCDTYFDGYKTKTGGIKDPAAFHNYTKDFILRRERKDVLPDLPLVFRTFNFCDLAEIVEDEYKKTVKEFNHYVDEESQYDSGIQKSACILAYLSKMRHLTGLSKIDPCCEYIEQFIMSMPVERKIMIFVHHKDVGEILKIKLEKMAAEYPAEWGKGICQIVSEMDGAQRAAQVEKFRTSDYRIMIGSTLASGEGLNLQFCSDCIMLERQWNPANEEQAEARFPRPGSTADKINAIYYVAIGTVDEFFSELVERKREIVNKTLSGEAVKWDQTSLMADLAQVIRQKGGQKWGF